MEKDFYNKMCIVRSLKFVIDEADRTEIRLPMIRFSCILTTMLARDKESNTLIDVYDNILIN
ncbi:hypothetical protein C1646_750795 [Rhizophagus diaphanus]|nr:hypothetical protein C1646_750795 [Rhizophagus diaphanus] [Rhizophagus sp. MUCL 43196]